MIVGGGRGIRVGATMVGTLICFMAACSGPQPPISAPSSSVLPVAEEGDCPVLEQQLMAIMVSNAQNLVTLNEANRARESCVSFAAQAQDLAAEADALLPQADDAADEQMIQDASRSLRDMGEGYLAGVVARSKAESRAGGKQVQLGYAGTVGVVGRLRERGCDLPKEET